MTMMMTLTMMVKAIQMKMPTNLRRHEAHIGAVGTIDTVQGPTPIWMAMMIFLVMMTFMRMMETCVWWKWKQREACWSSQRASRTQRGWWWRLRSCSSPDDCKSGIKKEKRNMAGWMGVCQRADLFVVKLSSSDLVSETDVKLFFFSFYEPSPHEDNWRTTWFSKIDDFLFDISKLFG